MEGVKSHQDVCNSVPPPGEAEKRKESRKEGREGEVELDFKSSRQHAGGGGGKVEVGNCSRREEIPIPIPL